MKSETWKPKYEKEVKPSSRAWLIWQVKILFFEVLLPMPVIGRLLTMVVNFMLRLNIFCANFLEENTISDYRERERNPGARKPWWRLLLVDPLLPWWHLMQGLLKLLAYGFDFDELEKHELKPTTWNANMIAAFAKITTIGAAAATNSNA